MPLRSIRSLLCLSLLTLGCSASAEAGLLDLFSGSGSIRCAPRDRACLVDAALAIATRNYANREVKENYQHHAESAGRLLLLVPEAERDAVRQRWSEAGADADFFSSFDKSVADNGPTDWITLDVLRTALETEKAPNGLDLGEFTNMAFPIVLKQEPDAALALWNEHFEWLWDQGFGTVVVFKWMTENDIDALERYAQAYNFPKSGLYDPWEGISLTAAHFCNKGDKASGERLLAILEREKTYWKADREMKAMDLSRMTSGILACRGEAEAMAMVDPVLSQMDGDLAAAAAKIQDKQGVSFVQGVIRSEVAENMIQPLALHLKEKGRRDDAIKLFARLPSQASTMTLGDIADKGILGMEFAEQSFDELTDLNKDSDFYSDDPKVALTWFVEVYDPNGEGCCQDRAEDVVEKLPSVWSDPIARKAAEKSLRILADRARKEPATEQSDLDIAGLKIATIERREDGCALGDARLGEVLSSASNYAYDEQRVDMLIAYLTYLDTTSTKPAQKGCLVE